MDLFKKSLTIVLIWGLNLIPSLALSSSTGPNTGIKNAIHSLTLDATKAPQELAKAKKLNPFRVTLFGASRIKQDHPASQAAYKLAQQLAKDHISIITGGSSGIMQAGNCGAASIKSDQINSLGVTKSNLEVNKCIQKELQFDSFAIRKSFLMQLSNAYVFFPGGYGTLDELGEVLSLIQEHELAPGPVILFGKAYWQPLMDWLREKVFPEKLVAQEYQDIITITDSVETVRQIILAHKKQLK